MATRGLHMRVSHISVPGIVLGVFGALVCDLLLNLLGLGFGMVAASPYTDTGTVSWSAFAWWSIAGIISAFVGGWIAGMMVIGLDDHPGFHGLATWAITTVLVIAGATFAASGALAGLAGPSFMPLPPDAASSVPQTAIGSAALASFVALIIGAFASVLGGRMAVGHVTGMQPQRGQPAM